jgi:hypothetical protein
LLLLGSSARAAEIRTDVPVLGQVRQGYLSGDTEAPIELYGDLGVSRLPHGTTLDTYFRLEEDFATFDESKTQFFSGVLRCAQCARPPRCAARTPDRQRGPAQYL